MEGGPDAAGGVMGRVEVCYAERWGAVCEPGFDDFAACVACRQLGYAHGRRAVADPLPGEGLGP